MPEPNGQQTTDTAVADQAAVAEATKPEGKDVDFEALYKKEVTNSISLRDRAQTAEATIEQGGKDAEKVRLANLEADGKIKELNGELTTKNETLATENAAFAEKFKVIEEADLKEREELLGKLPEEERAMFKKVDTVDLRTIVAKATGTTTPGTDSRRPGGGTGQPIQYRHDMTPEEKKEWIKQKTAANS